MFDRSRLSTLGKMWLLMLYIGNFLVLIGAVLALCFTAYLWLLEGGSSARPRAIMEGLDVAYRAVSGWAPIAVVLAIAVWSEQTEVPRLTRHGPELSRPHQK